MYKIPLPHVDVIPDKIDPIFNVAVPDTMILNSKIQALHETRQKIDTIDPKKWAYKKNSFFVYDRVWDMCSFRPISRAFFKGLEILHELGIKALPNAICLAEAPGGFMEAIHHSLRPNLILGISLRDLDKNAPTFDTLKSKAKTGMQFVYGDLYNSNTIRSIVEPNTFNFVSADGAFDFSEDYNSQESMVFRLLIGEFVGMLQSLSIGGNFVCKLFDATQKPTLQMIYLLCYCFEEVYLFKPLMSRSSNSERYILCKGLKECALAILPNLESVLNQWPANEYCHSLFNETTTPSFQEFTETLEQAFGFHIQLQINTLNEMMETITTVSNPFVYGSKFALLKEYCKKFNL